MWIELNGAVNVRDLGGLPTRSGTKTRHGRLLRSDNLQGLTADDVDMLTDQFDVRDIIDLRTAVEIELEGPGPLTKVPTVRIHHYSLLPEAGDHTDVAAVDGDVVLPWHDRAGRDDAVTKFANRAAAFYLDYLIDRPDSVVGALRTIGRSEGAAVVHCAAGKDRTGVISALALDVAGVQRSAIVDDYVRTGERVERILTRLSASNTYAADLNGRSADSHLPRPETMRDLLAHLDDDFGGSASWLKGHGWTDDDTRLLRNHLTLP